MNKTLFNKLLERHEHYLRSLLDEQNIPASRLKEAMYYAVFSGGKRLRPLLIYLTGQIFNINPQCLDAMAASIELMHCYSLIHDDLPAMDNDDFRRGKPSCHRAFDEATAILAGDSLQILAIDVLLQKLPLYLPAQNTLNATQVLINASGASGMASGQCLDLQELIKPDLSEHQLRHIHLLKTGKLFAACINMVIATTDEPPLQAKALRDYAAHLGLVFQMQDDYLDVYGRADLSGKDRASDQANQKTTFASLFSQHELRDLIDSYYHQAYRALTCFADKANDLEALTRRLQQRI